MPLTVLDFVLPALLLLFLPLGFWRGLWREMITSVGILLAAATTLMWTGVWASLLANVLQTDQPTRQLIAQLIGFLAITVLVAYGSGLLPMRMDSGTFWTRLMGALVSLINGSVIFSFILQFVYYYYTALRVQPNPVSASAVAWNLANWAGWFYMLLALLGLAAVALSALARIVAALSRVARKPAPAASGEAPPAADIPAKAAEEHQPDIAQG